MVLLRKIALNSGLVEEVKWGFPCYTLNNKNVFIISAFKENCTINFLKGVLLKDPENVLEKPGENSNVGRFLRFSSVQQIKDLESTINSYMRDHSNRRIRS